MSQSGSLINSSNPITPDILTLTGDSGGPVGPTGGNIDILGGSNITVTGNPGTSTLTIDSTIEIDGDVGSTSGNPITFNAQSFAGGSVVFSASGSTVDLLTTDSSLNIFIGEGTPAINTGAQNTAVGYQALNIMEAPASYNTAFGYQALFQNKTGSFNCGIGRLAFGGLGDLGSYNTGVGFFAGQGNNFGSGLSSYNTAVGAIAYGFNNTAGSYNICMGYLSGKNYDNVESSNIIIGNFGVNLESNTIRIGTQGVGDALQNRAFMAGIYNTTPVAGSLLTVIIDSAGQLGSTASYTPVQTVVYTAVAFGASPYTVLSTDYYIGANVTGGAITIKLPNAPATGRVYIVKDVAGLAAANNITVTTVGGAVNIDGATTFVMNAAYQAAQFIFNSSTWEIF